MPVCKKNSVACWSRCFCGRNTPLKRWGRSAGISSCHWENCQETLRTVKERTMLEMELYLTKMRDVLSRNEKRKCMHAIMFYVGKSSQAQKEKLPYPISSPRQRPRGQMRQFIGSLNKMRPKRPEERRSWRSVMIIGKWVQRCRTRPCRGKLHEWRKRSVKVKTVRKAAASHKSTIGSGWTSQIEALRECFPTFYMRWAAARSFLEAPS